MSIKANKTMDKTNGCPVASEKKLFESVEYMSIRNQGHYLTLAKGHYNFQNLNLMSQKLLGHFGHIQPTLRPKAVIVSKKKNNFHFSHTKTMKLNLILA